MICSYHHHWLHITNDISSPRTITNLCIQFFLIPRRNGYKNSSLELTETFSNKNETYTLNWPRPGNPESDRG